VTISIRSAHGTERTYAAAFDILLSSAETVADEYRRLKSATVEAGIGDYHDCGPEANGFNGTPVSMPGRKSVHCYGRRVSAEA
jgi:hypothetical protein